MPAGEPVAVALFNRLTGGGRHRSSPSAPAPAPAAGPAPAPAPAAAVAPAVAAAPSARPAEQGALRAFLLGAGVEEGASLNKVLATLDEEEVRTPALLRQYWSDVAPLLKLVPRKRIEAALKPAPRSNQAVAPLPPSPPPPAALRAWPAEAWCHNLPVHGAAVPEAPLLAAFGVLSHHTRFHLREAVRLSWLRSVPQDVHARFVLPALHVDDDDQAAALALELRRAPHEFALLNVSARAPWNDGGRAMGALHWLHCATRAYPLVPYLGRVCDSTWLHAHGVALMLRATLPWLRKPYEAVIGRLHAFVGPSNLTAGPTPAQWCGAGLRVESGEPSQLTARRLLLDSCLLLLSGGAAGALAQRAAARWPATAAPPGAALLDSTAEVGATALVYMSNDIYLDGWGFKTTQTALAWSTMAVGDFPMRATGWQERRLAPHSPGVRSAAGSRAWRASRAWRGLASARGAPLSARAAMRGEPRRRLPRRRATVLHHWAQSHHCGGDLPSIRCDHRRLSGSCESGPIFPCFAGRLPGCSVNQVDLWPHARELCGGNASGGAHGARAQGILCGEHLGGKAKG